VKLRFLALLGLTPIIIVIGFIAWSRYNACRDYGRLNVAIEKRIDISGAAPLNATHNFCADFVTLEQANDPLKPPCSRVLVFAETSPDNPMLPDLDAVLAKFPEPSQLAWMPSRDRDAWMRTRIEAALLVGAGPTTVFVRDGKVIAAANRTKDRERRGWNMDVRLKATRANLKWSVQDDEPADPRDVLLALLRDRDELK
jgi:hypothetical protein